MKKIVGILSLAVVLLTLYACQISVAPSQSPTDTPPQVTQPDQYQYSTFMQNIKVYNVEDTSLTPEAAAQQLMTLFLDDLSRPSQVRTFQITQYKNLRVEVLPMLMYSSSTSVVGRIRQLYSKSGSSP